MDIISDLDLSALYQFHIEKKGLATLAVRHRPGKRFLLVDDDGQLAGMAKYMQQVKRSLQVLAAEGLSEIAFSSMHIAEPEIFNYMNEGIYTMIDFYLRLAAES